ncbi:class I SAM-dependent methyltransferase [Dietzia maris]|uniref:THUMP-like domain-containing protein n=1 Tax=Dietzia TaxID=37914 RepID=UPI0022B460A1|nr:MULTISPECIES: class I SAM-dependent methyltransferase [Dietzia]MCZ4538751.1 class I SAM-dependent methyltransferase [Dietzia maris]MDV3355244.1 class I SAM-dependent methyltransferase [Dietzia sp. IN118]
MTPEDLEFLRTAAGRDLLDLAAGLAWSRADLVASTAAVRRADPVHAAAAIDVVTARARARGGIRGAGAMLLTDEAVQQATAWPVAALRAGRLAGRDVHDVTCSVGAELAELVRRADRVIGSDLDPVRARMAAHNVPDALVCVADALAPPSRDAVLVADPARRSGGRRVHDPARLSPPLPDLLAVAADRDHVIKCAPGLDTSVLDHCGEVELVSLDGSVREACLWSPGLSAGVRRRATVVRTAAADAAGPWGPPRLVADGVAVHVEEVTDGDDDEVDAHEEAERFIVDPDGAVVRAGLVRHWARRHGLRQLDPRIAHLTGPRIPDGYTGFEVLEKCRLDRKQLRRVLRQRDCGSLEILVRGVDTDPDVLRRSLSLSGSRPLALVVTRIGSSAVVFVCGPRTAHSNT